MYFLSFVSVCLCSTYTAQAVSQGALRFFRNGVADTNQSWSSGIVQIYYGSNWGNICDDGGFEFYEADVICNQIGYIGSSSYSNTGTTSTWGTDYSGTSIHDVSCTTSDLLTITQCFFSTTVSSNCSDASDVIVNCYAFRIWSNPVAGDIRLTGGTYSNQSLLEVYCNGEWGTVCDNSFSSTEARIACQQLGYNNYLTYNQLSLQGSSSQSIWLNTVTSCSSSTDVCLTECGACPSSAITSCSHSEDVTLECQYSSSYLKSPSVTSDSCKVSSTGLAPVGTIRLYRNGVADTNQSWSSGIVQIYYGSSWGNICDDDDSFGSNEADVICHQLGYTGASSNSNAEVTELWGTDNAVTAMDDVSCLSSYLTVTQCSFSTSISATCNDHHDVIVECYATRVWDAPSTGDVRLTGGRYSSEGLLEVYCNGEWGTVCDDLFSTTQARVACRQLGYNDYDQYDHLPYHGNSSQSIWLRSWSGCSFSTDTCLTSCGGCPSQSVTTCDHSKDVTLSCEFDSFYSKVSTNTSDTCSITATDPTTFDTVDTANLVGAIVGSVVGLTVCILVLTFVPICVCTCISVGVGAAGSRGTRATRLLRTTPTQQNKSTSITANLSQEDTTALVQQCYPVIPAQQGEKDVSTGSGLPEQYYPSETPLTAPQGGYPTSYPPTEQSNYYSQQPQEPPPAYPTAPTAPLQQEGYPFAHPPATTYPPQQLTSPSYSK